MEASEQLDIIPQRLRIVRHERVKYAWPWCDGSVRLAAKRAQLITMGLFNETELAWMATSKYLDGLPLYRQAVLLGRFGGTDISRNTVAASMVRAGAGAQPVVSLLRDELLEVPLVFGDETEQQVLKEAGSAAQTGNYMWAQMTDGAGRDGTGPPIQLFTYLPSRSTKTAMGFYADMHEGAVLMTDGYEASNAVADTQNLVHLGCWTHARRYFHEALQALPKNRRGPEQLAAQFIALIGKFCQVEAQARQDGVDAAERGSRRQQGSVPVLAEIEALLLANLNVVLPESLLGQALHYLSSQWSKLKRYVEDGRYCIDNYVQENAMRPFLRGPAQLALRGHGGGCERQREPVLARPARSTASTATATCALFVALPNARTVDNDAALLPWRIDLGAT